MSKEFDDFMNTLKPNYLEKKEITNKTIFENSITEFENVGDEKLFPNYTDKDIWVYGFNIGAQWYREQLKNNK
jgi:hypothetical protein